MVLPLKVHPVVCDTKNTDTESINELLNVVVEEAVCNGWVLDHCSAAAGTGIRIIRADEARQPWPLEISCTVKKIVSRPRLSTMAMS